MSRMAQLASLKSRAPRWLLDTADVTSRGAALATAANRPVPDFLIIGTKRGGTTSLFKYLAQHPGVLALYPQPRDKKSTDYYFSHKFNTQSERWYRSHFHTEAYRRLLHSRLGYRPLSFEASPYYVWDPRIAARVRQVAPGTKAILLVRDPVKRAWSHYQERVQNGVEPLDFEDALAAEDDRLAGEPERMADDPSYHSTTWDWYSYRRRGVYLPQVQRWHACFPATQLLVLRSEDLYRHTQAVVDEICDFLGLPRRELSTTRGYNSTLRSGDEPPQRAVRALREYYRPHNAALEDYLRMSLGW
ncbi:sulfotransferase domain-containing protein [Ornithinicoccus halotolerans]|uniref:sulfotransferase domain-containing protein n=1 Tax=Ornithinicoccus halotolerans TaxID=1748220 RepID=UPI001E353862|nr:sulfotransferase domain-containing protein [Ornithinicoccus halotolerans]